MERVLERETRTFESVAGATIEDMSCTFDEGSSRVSCTGRIVALYGTEETEFPLTSYRVVQEEGGWNWCGEAGPYTGTVMTLRGGWRRLCSQGNVVALGLCLVVILLWIVP